ncbi:unnamed protein product [Adineta steineri]|uniref:D-alanyl-D-alanine carboxypeptidase/D-alanyl-D-alanine-endopeptidase n=1 Tax=Adineta steineri TaxID=433720 RepID=A0A813MCB3_9BILA|nr:unnamed protein product [Adineta steineri]CAF3845803.1 unnamed protein product [Adineta steineri]
MFFKLENFTNAWQKYIEDPHVAHASYSMTVLDAQTGSILFQHAKDIGLPPASSLKTITAAAALHYLGPNYTYETLLQYSGTIHPETGFLDRYIYIVGSGDPSLGDTSQWNNTQTLLIDGWTWNDIGHSYGTGHSALNWRENEFTIAVQPGSTINSPAHLGEIKNPPPRLQIRNELITSSSDGEASLYFSLDGSNIRYLRGFVSLNAPANFSLHCAVPNSALYVADELTKLLRINEIKIEQEATVDLIKTDRVILLDIHQSPPLSKLLQPFLRNSINMYGEVFIKTIAHKTQQSSLLDAPVKILSLYIKTLLNNEKLLNGMTLMDGSGLSRSNRLSTYTLTQILFQIQKEAWFNDVYYEAFPIINGLRMKSGTLMNTIAYAGYVRENSFVFSFIINNYHSENGSDMRTKIWSVLDTLK